MSDIVVTLPDGSELEVEAGSTVEDVAYGIGPGLGEDTVGGIVDGDLASTSSSEPSGNVTTMSLMPTTSRGAPISRSRRWRALRSHTPAMSRMVPSASGRRLNIPRRGDRPSGQRTARGDGGPPAGTARTASTGGTEAPANGGLGAAATGGPHSGLTRIFFARLTAGRPA